MSGYRLSPEHLIELGFVDVTRVSDLEKISKDIEVYKRVVEDRHGEKRTRMELDPNEEAKSIELKKEINKLKDELGVPPVYSFLDYNKIFVKPVNSVHKPGYDVILLNEDKPLYFTGQQPDGDMLYLNDRKDPAFVGDEAISLAIEGREAEEKIFKKH